MNVDAEFEKALAVLENTVTLTYGSARGDLSEDKYRERVHLARRVFDIVWPSGLRLLDVVFGIQQGEAYGHGARSPLNFPARFMKVASIRELTSDKGPAVQAVLDQTLRLGLMCHLVIWQFPTRVHMDQVDISALEKKWLLEALVADQLMKPLDKAGEVSTLQIFDCYYRIFGEAVLKSAGIDFFGRAQTPSFFRNLFCAGWLLGMSFDLATSQQS
jgi:hypothetical protein